MTVRGSSTTMLAALESVSIPITRFVYCSPSMPRRNVYSTSSAVIGVPSEKVALGSSLNVSFVRSLEASMLRAIIGAGVFPSATRAPRWGAASKSINWS